MINPFELISSDFCTRLECPGQTFHSSAKTFGELLKDLAAKNPNFYLFSPDETTSNKLDAIYQSTSRAWANLPIKDWDLSSAPDGRIIELLSENTLFAVMLGHLLAGHPAMLTSYEAFFTIITAQIVQHLKFLEQSATVTWRPAYPAANLLSTSTCWRQDHNGFSHQSPLLISALLSRPSQHLNCLFPVDDIGARAAFDYMIHSQNVVNLTTFNKTDEPRWIDSLHAKFQYTNGGASIFGFASDPHPDFIFTAAGDIATRESLYAIKILKTLLPELQLRFVGVTALTSAPLHHQPHLFGAIGTTDRQLSPATFVDYFTADRPIIANFHGYPAIFQQILSHYADPRRISVHGFIEQGSTTTPFEMLSLNRASRYHLCLDVLAQLQRPDLAAPLRQLLAKNTAHATATSLDLPEITDFQF